MKLIKTDRPEKNLVRYEIQVEAEEFAKAMDKAYRSAAPKLNIPGFRKGKAPKATVVKYVGEQYFYEDAVNNSCYDAYLEAVKQDGSEPVDSPEIESVDKISHDGYTFKVKVYTKPEIDVDGYKGLKAERGDDKVTDEEFQNEFNRLTDRASRMVDVDDRPAKAGDEVCIAFDGYVDGKQFEGGKSDHTHLVLGSGQFIPGFEDQIVGRSIGDKFDVKVTFPEDYHAEELKGKDAEFKTELHEIHVKEMPELDDELAKDISEFNTLDELKADLRTKLQERKTASVDEKVETELVDQLCEKITGDIPQCMFTNKAEELLEDFAYRLQSQGLDLKKYTEYTGRSMDEMKAQFLPEAERQIKTSLALERIAAKEKLEAAAEEVDKKYAELAEQYKMELDKIKEALSQKNVESEIKLNKAIDLIKANAVITGEKAEKTEKAAKSAEKKPAAKSKAKPKTEKAEASEKAEKKEKPAAKKPGKADADKKDAE